MLVFNIEPQAGLGIALFEFAGMILFAAIVDAIVVSIREIKKEMRRFDSTASYGTFEQV